MTVPKLSEDQIASEYQRMEEESLEKWQAHPSVGRPIVFPYDRSLLAIALGQHFRPCQILSILLEELHHIAENDPSVEVPDGEWLHITFLALSPHLYTNAGDFPDDLHVVKDLYDRYVKSVKWGIRDVCLVPTANSLLLAGIPNKAAISARQRIAEELLESPWEPLIRTRYAGYPIPPLIWHTTLMRSRCEYLPEAARNLYQENKSKPFADIDLNPPLLAAVTYNWSRVQPVRDVTGG